MTDTQQAAVLTGARTIELRQVEIPEPGPDEVRVRLQGCGVCASNLPVWEGRPWFGYPLAAGAPGHEGWGIVDAIGRDIYDVELGERVAFLSDRAYAQYDVAARSAMVRLPSELRDHPFPGEPLGCAMNIFERSDIRAGQCVAVVGAGFLGLLLTQLATHEGAEVVALSRRSFALQRAREAGATVTLDSSDVGAATKQALALTGGRGYDRVIEVAGLQSTLDLASALTAEGSRLIIAGYHQDGLRQVNLQEWNWRGLDVVNAHERDRARYVYGMQRAVDAVLAGRIEPFGLLTHEVSLGNLNEGFQMMHARPPGFLKAVLQLEAGR
jgi:threonine dehydrogenase-like Zn-dependent dehydrogenase